MHTVNETSQSDEAGKPLPIGKTGESCGVKGFLSIKTEMSLRVINCKTFLGNWLRSFVGKSANLAGSVGVAILFIQIDFLRKEVP